MEPVSLTDWQQAAIFNPYKHFAFFGGYATGKSYTGSRFSIRMIIEHPHLTGFIGANTYDQLSQASLRHFFSALEDYGLDFISDRKPPPHWKVPYLKSYKNTVVVYNNVTRNATLVFTRVLSKPHPLRGVEFSWYWLDETRDTPQTTHDVVISRMREDAFTKGIITTTTNGHDWTHKRFCLAKKGLMYGAMHIPTRMSLEAEIITQDYYDTMLESFDELTAQQELEALHVNTQAGRAYYSCSQKNKMRRAPWGDHEPDKTRPLIVGCDFNFSPAPCVWIVGQMGPAKKGPNKEDWSESFHWFGEVSGKQMSTPAMTNKLVSMYPGFNYIIYGDSSGEVGTTSNAGNTDYMQISTVLESYGVFYSIDRYQYDIKSNPRVRERVENVNRLLLNSMGKVTVTYDPMRCPLLEKDFAMVGWKNNVQMGKGKLDDCGNKDLTHASDAAGYALHKIFPPAGKFRFIAPTKSKDRIEALRSFS